MKERFKSTAFRAASLDLLQYCNSIVTDYMEDGLRLTLRQLYYQLVSANVVPNTEKSYKNVGKLVSNARLAGMLDWDAIEDRVRKPKHPPEFSSLRSLVDAALSSYRLPRLVGQAEYIEVWVEKDALAGVLEPIVREHHVVLMVNRGYSSQSAMYESAQRIEAAVDRYECNQATVLYLGDLDPSGEDMVRDIQDRLDLFSYGSGIEVEKVALTIEQVEAHNLPPNPAKLSDSRARAFIAKYGPKSWELDALPPRVLQSLVHDALSARMDLELMEEVKEQEERDKEILRVVSKGT
jgi:hypothetical protein